MCVYIYIHVVDDPDWTQKFLAPAVYSDTRTLLSKFLRQNTFCVETFSWDDWSVHVSRRRGSYHGSMTPESALQFVCCTNTFYTLLSSIWSLWSCLVGASVLICSFCNFRCSLPDTWHWANWCVSVRKMSRFQSQWRQGGKGVQRLPYWSILPVPKEVSYQEKEPMDAMRRQPK